MILKKTMMAIVYKLREIHFNDIKENNDGYRLQIERNSL